MTTATSSPRERRAKGSEPTTSARPPVLAKGAASEETMRTRVTSELYQGRVGKTRGWRVLNRFGDPTNGRPVPRGKPWDIHDKYLSREKTLLPALPGRF